MGINYMASEHALSESIFVEMVSAVLSGIEALPPLVDQPIR
jgi:hypothetical protein